MFLLTLLSFPAKVQPPFGFEMIWLTDFATVRRYEEGSLEWGLDEVREAQSLYRSAQNWARGVLSNPGH